MNSSEKINQFCVRNFITSGVSTYRHDGNIGISKGVYGELNKGSGIRSLKRRRFKLFI